MAWTVETLNALVDDEVAALPLDMRARLVRLTDLIEQIGFEALPRDSVKRLEDRLWEFRMTGAGSESSRAIYVTATGRRVVILRVFIKKTRRRRRVNSKSPAGGPRK